MDDAKQRRSKRVPNGGVGTTKKEKVEKEELKKRKRLRSEDIPSVAADFAKLEMNSLKAYRRHFKLDVRPNAPKIELVNAATKHFASMPKFRETEVISAFLHKIRRERATRESLKIANQIRP
uniref:Histone deacetylase complex subunit SAP30 Sin3 binding domain-containing protein n=1 Tax=Spongospora subterranea TaxID=70186 RepID=A0A0H5R6Q1_9EUKA|eukprot:CRZ09788.1 hypothetical protein [Spongospora subterranea]